MTTGPRETPHPIILHVDDQGNPVRLAEASSIYVTTVSAVSISATNYLGLNLNSPGVPVGQSTEIQFRKNDTEFDGDTSLTFDKENQRLRATEIVVGDLSSTNKIFSEETITALQGFSGASLSATSSRIGNLSATVISAITVCATNYNSLFDSLSLQNLDSRYLNSSGDSVTGSFVVQNLSAATISATNYLNLSSNSAIWNANSLQGIPVTSTPPSQLQSLIYKDGVWQPSSVAGVAGGVPGGNTLTIQFNNGIFSGVDSVKYSESISGISLTTLSSTNLSSVNIRVATISATTYQNNGSGLPVWNAQKIQDVPVSKPGIPSPKDILAIDSGGTTFEKTGIDDYAGWVYATIKPTIHAELPQTDASSLRGYQVTSTAPINNQLLMYSGTAWVPTSSTFNLGTVNTTNSTASVLTAVTGTVTTLSATSARITGLSATTISAVNWQGLPSAVATWNASALQSGKVLGANTPTGQLGFLSYNPALNEYQAISISSLGNNGNGSLGFGAASYLASANSNYFAINEGWQIFSDYPENKDVLVFSSNMYGFGTARWTWQQASSLVPAAGTAGYVQFAGQNGAFSGDVNLTYNPTTGLLTTSSISLPSGTIFLAAPANPTYISNQSLNVNFLQVYTSLTSPSVSATTYKIFGRNTSSANTVAPPTNNNQNIVYDSGQQQWKPGYAVYQATATPDNTQGNNGDIYFQYLP